MFVFLLFWNGVKQKESASGCGVTELVSQWTWVVLMCFARVQSGGDEETGVFRGAGTFSKFILFIFVLREEGEIQKKND